MKLADLKKRSEIQILLPVFVFIIIVILILVIMIPHTRNSDKIHLADADTVYDGSEADIAEMMNTALENNSPSESKDSSMNDFFRRYYDAAADGNVKAFSEMYDTETGIPDVKKISELVDHYEHVRVYTAEGMQPGEIAAFVYSDVFFYEIESAAPSVDSFYLSKNDDLRIMSAMYGDPVIAEYLRKMAEKDPVQAVMKNTDSWLDMALKKDQKLYDMYSNMMERISTKR